MERLLRLQAGGGGRLEVMGRGRGTSQAEARSVALESHILEGRRRLAIAAAAVIAAAFLFGACGGTEVDSPIWNEPQASAESTPASAAVTRSVSLDALTNNQIVAAHEQVVNSVYERALPSVVQIHVTQRVEDQQSLDFLSQFAQGQDIPDLVRSGEGSGFVWDEEGHIVTNHHVVAGADMVTATFSDGSMVELELLGSDSHSDIAVLKTRETENIPAAVELGDSDELIVGQVVLALGNPFGQEFTLTSGIISGLGREMRSGNSPFSVPHVVQTDAAINPGNSGGPLLDRNGRVIAISTQIASQTGGSMGVGFGIPVNTAKLIVPELISKGSYEYSFLGISGFSLTPPLAEAMRLPDDSRGTVIGIVLEDSPAQEAGLRGSPPDWDAEGAGEQTGPDVIVAINGADVRDFSDLIEYLSDNTRPGENVDLTVIRDGETMSVEVTLGTRPS